MNTRARGSRKEKRTAHIGPFLIVQAFVTWDSPPHLCLLYSFYRAIQLDNCCL